MTNLLSGDEARKTLTQHILGPRGGLFALGILFGMSIMHFYMMEYVVEDLRERFSTLEQSNKELNERLQRIAFEKLAE